jgi:hypothetical protein
MLSRERRHALPTAASARGSETAAIGGTDALPHRRCGLAEIGLIGMTPAQALNRA